MLWAYTALAGRVAFLGVERVIVKKLGEARGSEDAACLFFGLAAVFLLPVLFFTRWPGPAFLPGVIAAGALYSIANVFYVRSLSEGEVSLVAPLLSLSTFFLLMLAVVFLGEPLTAPKLAGTACLVLGASLLEEGASLITSLRKLFAYRPAQYMVISALFTAAGRVIDKHLNASVSPLLYAFVLNLVVGLFLAGYLAVRGRRSAVLSLLAERPGLAFLSGFVNAYSYLLLLVALRWLDVSVAEPATSCSLLLSVLLGYLVYREPIRRRLPAAALIVAGVWLLLA